MSRLPILPCRPGQYEPIDYGITNGTNTPSEFISMANLKDTYIQMRKLPAPGPDAIKCSPASFKYLFTQCGFEGPAPMFGSFGGLTLWQDASLGLNVYVFGNIVKGEFIPCKS